MKQFQISHTQYIDSPENKQLQQKEEKHFDEELFLFDLNKIKGICYLSLPLPPRCEKLTSFIYFYTALYCIQLKASTCVSSTNVIRCPPSSSHICFDSYQFLG